jgi:hypothetical protein
MTPLSLLLSAPSFPMMPGLIRLVSQTLFGLVVPADTILFMRLGAS